MAEKRDYYEVLGVGRGDSVEEIRKAYRRQARQLHPDVNRDDPRAEERFKELGEAYEVLSDPQKRAAYDRFGHAAVSGIGGQRGGSVFDDFGFGDLFESFFGSGPSAGRRPDPRGGDLLYELEVTLEEAAFGAERSIRVPRQMTCESCRGAGSEYGGPIACPTCNGAGQRRQASDDFFGLHFTTVTTCERCGGLGEIIPNPCKACGGTGRVRGVDEVQVRVPVGVDTGSRIRYRGRGDVGFRGAQAGDLIVVLRVRPHEVFERRDTELLCRVPLPFATAALGGKLAVPTLEGEAEIDIPPGTQTEQSITVRGMGMPELQGRRRGNLHVVVTVAVPTDLSPRQRELLREFARELGENAEHKPKGVFQKVKDAVEDYRERAREASGG